MTPLTTDEEFSKPDCYPFDRHSVEDSDCDREILDNSYLMHRQNTDHLPCSFGREPEQMGTIIGYVHLCPVSFILIYSMHDF